jgi:hypothetical protein
MVDQFRDNLWTKISRESLISMYVLRHLGSSVKIGRLKSLVLHTLIMKILQVTAKKEYRHVHMCRHSLTLSQGMCFGVLRAACGSATKFRPGPLLLWVM